MFLKYLGNKKELNLTRPELEDEYLFVGDAPTEVSYSDGVYLLREFLMAFEQTKGPEDPAPPAPTAPKAIKTPKAPTI